MIGQRDRRKSAPDAGAIATEFALLMAFVPLTVMVFGIVDFGAFMEQSTKLAAIVRGADEYARGQVVQGKALPTAADLQNLLGVPAEVFSTTSFCTCADGSTPSPLPNCPALSSGIANPCTASPPANGDLRVLKYVKVVGSQTYMPWISGTWSFPGSVQRQTVFRTQ